SAKQRKIWYDKINKLLRKVYKIMNFISGENRNQMSLFPVCMDDYIDENNPSRVIDAYVDILDLEQMGFEKTSPNDTGRPRHSPYDLLKPYIYGYMNKIRSSRKLETETRRNIEVIWLLKKLSPDHKTIALFRRDNPRALKNVFRDFVRVCDSLGLSGKEPVAVDGSRFKAWNAKDRNFTKDKLADRIKRIDNKIEEYLKLLDDSDRQDCQTTDVPSSDISGLISSLRQRKDAYVSYLDELKNNGETQMSLTGPDSRLMKTKNGLDVCLNIQAAVDSRNKMIAEFSVENNAQDKNFMGKLAEKSAEILKADALTVVADNGYDSASDVAGAVCSGMTPIVAGCRYEFCVETDKDHAEEISDYGEETGKSIYLPKRNIFVCPMGKALHPSSYNKNKHIAGYKNYSACKNCTRKCTSSAYYRAERTVKPSEYSREYNDRELYLKKVQISENKEIAIQRKSIIEHVFGTVKRNPGISCLLRKGMEKVEGGISLAFLAFNMKRAINILGVRGLIKAMEPI
ncbi:MAG: IS1182 family transposase, partial [Ruminococcus flavefaciens]|nr:IS1182 family transposase [Ruminococcus flavefaciens]